MPPASQKDAPNGPGPSWSPPSEFDQFSVQGPLGSGGMGHVYLGRDVALDRPIALKFISSPDPSPAARSRFLVEARAIAKLSHPNVVNVYRVGEVDGHPYIAYEFVAGQSLDRIAKPLAWDTALRLGVGLARGLAAAHGAGILHRDIKPGNAVLGERGEIKLLDFGLAKLLDDGALVAYVPRAKTSEPPPEEPDSEMSSVDSPPVLREAHAPSPPRGGDVDAESSTERVRLPYAVAKRAESLHDRLLTRPGTVMGTPAYLAPELWWGDAATPRSDVFALGLVLYELLAGKLPHAHLDGEELAFAITDGELPSVRAGKPEIPESLAGIVARCLRREATERYASAVELVKALEEVESVFLPSLVPGSAVEMEPERLAVASSMARLSSRIQTLTTRLYERLFAADSSLRSLFPEELEAQKTKLAHALKLAIDGLAEPDRLVPVLEDLGRRHVRYGVVPGHFAELEKALLGALAELDHESWSPELEAAWRRAYSFIEQAMKRGMAAEHETMASSAALRRGTRRRPSSGETPRTRYAPSGDLSIAYQVVGEGPVDIVLMLGWITHVEIGWQHPTLANFLRELAGIGRLIFFDKRGTGMSDRAFESSTVEDRVDDLLAVLEHCGSKRAIVVGVSEGASTAAMFSLVHPSRVRGLVLYGASPRLLVDHDYPHGFPPAFLEEFVGKIRARWGDPSFTEMEAPSMARDVAFGEWLAMFMRMSASPGTAIAMFRLDAQLDLRRLLPKIALPTLVLHRSGDRIVPLAAARVLAEGIAAASFVELPGDDHLPFVGDSDAVLSAIERFVADVVESDVSATETAPLEAVLVVRQSDETPLPSAFADYCADRARSLGGERLPIDDAVVLAFRGGVKAVRCARELLDLAARAWLTIQMGLDASPRAPAGREHEMIAGATMLARTAPPSSVQASALLHELSRGSGLPFEPSADRSTCVLRASR